MNVLALDTSLGSLSIAVSCDAGDGNVARSAQMFEPIGITKAERLFPAVRDVMSTADIGFAELDRIAVTVGPGTFSGIRTGLAAARGMALATGLPLVGASSLVVMAAGAIDELGAAIGERPLAVCVDAHRSEIYAQLFDAGGHSLGAAAAIDQHHAAEFLSNRSVVAVGSGAALLSVWIDGSSSRIELALPELLPNAFHLARMAPTLTVSGPVRPLYLRAPDATPPTAQSLPRAPR